MLCLGLCIEVRAWIAKLCETMVYQGDAQSAPGKGLLGGAHGRLLRCRVKLEEGRQKGVGPHACCYDAQPHDLRMRLQLKTSQTFHHTCCTGALPSSLAENRQLELISTEGNRFNALPWEWLSGYHTAVDHSLKWLGFSFNNISGPFPKGLAQLPHLTYLLVNNNNFRWGHVQGAPCHKDGAFHGDSMQHAPSADQAGDASRAAGPSVLQCRASTWLVAAAQPSIPVLDEPKMSVCMLQRAAALWQ